jgi:hypothetical protein
MWENPRFPLRVPGGKRPPGRHFVLVLAHVQRNRRRPWQAHRSFLHQRRKPRPERPRLYKVILLNDDFTPREFVVKVLKVVFRMDRDEAFTVMLTPPISRAPASSPSSPLKSRKKRREPRPRWARRRAIRCISPPNAKSRPEAPSSLNIAPLQRISVRSFGDYGHKRARNKRIGPGGGTRRLHHPSFVWGSWGRNRIDERLKGLALSR